LAAVDKFVVHVDQKLDHLASAQFMNYLHDHILSIAKDLDYNMTMHYKKHSKRSNENIRPSEKHRNNVENQPRYVFLMAEDKNINLFLAAIMENHHKEFSSNH